MKITQIKINGIREPMGFRMEKPCVSFKVTGTASKKAENCRIQIVKEGAPEPILAEREGSDLNFTGESFALTLEPRTAYLVKIRVNILPYGLG